MSYVNSIGGDPINPNPYTYSAISMTGNITLGWPISGQSPTYSATDWVDISSSAAYAVTMPDATQVGVGQEVVFNNYGSYTITINDNSGGGITTITAGMSKRIHITTNSTAAGTWRVVNIGAGTSNADASALAGYGLVAAAGQLSQNVPVIPYNTNQTINSGSRASLALWSGGVGTFTLTAPATLGTNWFFNVRNSGSGTLTLNAGAALINGSATLDASVGEGFTVITDGSNFYSIGKIAPNSSGLTLLNKSVAGNTDVTLTAAEAAYNVINFTGALTGNINVIVPTSVRSWYFYNTTTGAYTLTVKTAAGTGVAITQTARAILYCDGTNVVSPITTTSGTVTSITAGTGLSGGVITTTGTVALANTAVAAGTYGGAIGVASHTVDAQGRMTADSFTARSITGTANEITVTNGDGIAGAPTISIPTAVTLTGKTLTGGSFASPALTGTPVAPTAAGGTSSTQVATTAFVSAVLANRNFLINGAFDVWQRAATYALTTTTSYGGADRWASNMATSAAGIFNRDTSITAGTGFQYNAKIGRNNGSALTGSIEIAQALESADSYALAGKTVTLSYYAKCGANYSSAASALVTQIVTGTGADQSVANMVVGAWTGSTIPLNANPTLTTSWQRFTHTVTLSSSATQAGVIFYYTPTGTAGADDNFYITGVQLEIGSNATIFDKRPYAETFSLCQRWLPAYNATTGSTIILANGACHTNSAGSIFFWKFKDAARIAPTGITVTNSATFNNAFYNASTTPTLAACTLTFGNASIDGCQLVGTATTGVTAGQATFLASVSASAQILFTGAEL